MVPDPRTMGLLLVITPFILGLIMLVYLHERKVYGGFKSWVFANFCFAIGNLLVLLRGIIPDFLSVVIGNSINVYGEILIYEGVQAFYGRSRVSAWNYLILAIYVLAQLYLTYVVPDINARIVLLSAAFFVLILRSGMQLLRCPIPALQTTSRSAGYLFIATAILPLFRGVYAYLQTEPLNIFEDELGSWFSLSILISLVAWTFFFFFLNSARIELELETARHKLELIAMTDVLTHSFNRRHFDEHAEIEFQRARRFERNLSFIMLDMDHFKEINDTHGHEAGDKVLFSVATTIESQVRSFDLVARYGGDEFIIMLLDTNDRHAYAVAERIRLAVEQSPVAGDFGEVHVSLSIGVTCVQTHDVDLAQILRRADAALYLAKREGRNRVVFA